MPRFFCSHPLQVGLSLDLPADTSRHIQVLRLQPGATITLFDGRGGEYTACILQMGRHTVAARIDSHQALERESAVYSHVVIGMPANERMDWLVEKATELGVARITPLMTAHGVLRLNAERALKRQLHWQGIAQAACAQSGRNTLPQIDVPQSWSEWLNTVPRDETQARWLLSLSAASTPLNASPEVRRVLLLSGPEGGLSHDEEAQALERGFVAVNLGARVLRAETAPLAVLSRWI
ncbi:MAG: 16S rRNA (uracil(1498)-N(3))-methyltransferase [Burkholderiaceae bacterium]|nr:16S rRNA (uracil(1498)-N(3))-methyltransferase [Burkholderiaceae bacterium]